MQTSLPFDAPAAAHAIVFVCHPRARRYLLRVVGDGSVRVTIPRWGSKREAAAFAEQQRDWIEAQRHRMAAARGQHRAIPIDPEARRAALERAKRELPVRLRELAAEQGLVVAGVSIRNQRSRWGSCSRRGHISLNWRLVEMPESVRDYVMIHELMHLKRMDHSPAFWALVTAACPESAAARRWLRTFGRTPGGTALDGVL